MSLVARDSAVVSIDPVAVAAMREFKHLRPDLAREGLERTIRLRSVRWRRRHVLQAVAFLGPGVGRVKQRHAAL